jgi:release factor glutamine methyltransferase
VKLADNTLKTAREFFNSELQPIWGDEVNSLFFIWWNEKRGWSRSEIQLNANERLSESELLDFLRAIKRLKNHEPIQYILGSVPFGDCTILVDSNVLIPRPETEEIVYRSLKLLKNIHFPVILDLCTGSGCIALAIKKNYPESTVLAVDFSYEAIQLAKKSAALNKLEVDFILEDVRKPTTLNYPHLDLIISNPPYVLEIEKLSMSENVLNFEPHLALFVENEDPLFYYRKMIENYIRFLKKDGILVFEINENLAKETMNILEESGDFTQIEVIKDLQGKERMVQCIKKSK